MSHPIILFSCNTLGRRIKSSFISFESELSELFSMIYNFEVSRESNWSNLGYEFFGIVENSIFNSDNSTISLKIYLMTIYGFSSQWNIGGTSPPPFLENCLLF